MSWVRKTTTGKYRACYRDPDGKTVSKVFDKIGKDTDGPITAKGWLAQNATKIADGEYIDPGKAKVKLQAIFDEYVKDLPSANSRDYWPRDWRNHIAPTFASRQVGGIRQPDVRRWTRELLRAGVGAPTVAKSLMILRATLERAVQDGNIRWNPAKGVRVEVRKPRAPRSLEHDEVRRLAEAHPERYRFLAYLLAYRGLRIGEAAALRVGDIDFLRGTLRITKTLSEVSGRLVEGPPKTEAGDRTVYLPAFLRDMLTAHLADFSDPADTSAYVFTSERHRGGERRPLRPGNYRKRVFAVAVRDAGLTERVSTPHDLRDVAATLAFKAGATVKEVSVMLGHANPGLTLKVYTDVLESMTATTNDALDQAYRELPANPAAQVRPFGGAEVVALRSS